MEKHGRLKALRVLFVDDDPWLRHSMEYYFKKRFSCFVALESGEEALERLKQEAFDVAICDYRLPGMNGVKFLKALEKIQPQAKRILVTAYPFSAVDEEASSIRIDEFIAKPFRAEHLKASLYRVTERP